MNNKDLKCIKKWIFLSVIIGIFLLMLFHVNYSKEKAEELKQSLIVKERQQQHSMSSRRESLGAGMLTSKGVHVEGAYFIAVPYIVFDLVLLILYIVCYHT